MSSYQNMTSNTASSFSILMKFPLHMPKSQILWRCLGRRQSPSKCAKPTGDFSMLRKDIEIYFSRLVEVETWRRKAGNGWRPWKRLSSQGQRNESGDRRHTSKRIDYLRNYFSILFVSQRRYWRFTRYMIRAEIRPSFVTYQTTADLPLDTHNIQWGQSCTMRLSAHGAVTSVRTIFRYPRMTCSTMALALVV